MRVLHFVIATSLAAAIAAPAPSSAASIIEGRKAWLRLNCYGCHGDDGGGARAPSVWRRSAAEVRSAMFGAFGASGMRSYVGVKGVKVTDFDDIAAYLGSIGLPTEPKWHDWWRR